jgi:hypothetical protein
MILSQSSRELSSADSPQRINLAAPADDGWLRVHFDVLFASAEGRGPQRPIG